MSGPDNAKPETGNASSAQQQDTTEKVNVPSLGALDEDDEFEEFESADWPEQDTVLRGVQTGDAGAASVALDMSGSARSGGDHLWEDNWDDDDIEDEFSVALRAELEKSNAPQPMEA